MSFNGWMLPDRERNRVLAMFPPRFPNVKATHVTLALEDKAIPQDAEIVLVGYTADDGVEALVCSVNGETTRPDGSTFHMTLSIADGRASKESNDVIAAHGWRPLDEEVPIETRGFMSRGGKYVTTPLSRAP